MRVFVGFAPKEVTSEKVALGTTSAPKTALLKKAKTQTLTIAKTFIVREVVVRVTYDASSACCPWIHSQTLIYMSPDVYRQPDLHNRTASN
jgi:hypothetical protein